MNRFFRIIIPNYNNGKWLEKSIGSVLNQTFQDFSLIVIDDCSTDGSVEILRKMELEHQDKMFLYECKRKRWNGGTRNMGLTLLDDCSEYTLFLDSDDWFIDNEALQKIHDKLIINKPDCLSLSYSCLIDNTCVPVPLERKTPQELVESIYVACWTKCIKSNLLVLFPENTLMEDVVQHIAQCDKLETVECMLEPMIIWNRNNLNSCSRKENQNCQEGKWQSSMYRYCADLLDLECKHDYCEAERKKRCDAAIVNVREGRYIQ